MSAPGNVRAAKDTRSDWETPWPLFRALDREFRFTLDAAATAENRKCERYLTAEEDALKADIFDQVVWCNPPYGRGLKNWTQAFARWSMNGCTVAALLPANTDTAWFRSVWYWAHEIRLMSGRVNFTGSSSGNTGGNLIAVYRPQVPPVVRRDAAGKVVAFENFEAPRITLWDWRA